MREIQFRGRDEQGRWHFGMLRVWRDQSFAIETTQGLAVDFVDPATVGQFTGLLDSNGKEIYEGDILRFAPPWRWEEDERRVGVIVYKYFAFVVKYGNKSVGIFNLASNEAPYTIIGNVHDNPELLKEGGE